MMAVFGIGLWAILSFGSVLLRAPSDLNGTWELRPPTGTVAPEWAAQSLAASHTITFEQSGRYLHAFVDGSPAAHPMTLTSEVFQHRETEPDEARLELTAARARFVLEGLPDGDKYALHAQGLLPGEWQMSRVNRSQPTSRKESATGSNSASAPTKSGTSN